MAIEHLKPPGLFNLPSFTQVVKSSGGHTVYIAGQGAFDADMNLVGPGDYRAQAAKACQNLALALEAAGASPEDVVSSVMYVKDMDADAVEAFITGMSEALDGAPFPPNASSLIGVQSLAMEGMLVEISAVAVID
jgi:enamine deaminase RidA (YjgF/YER057c/UK114 family)